MALQDSLRPVPGSAPVPAVKLYMFRGSNAVWIAELMLAHKGLAYEEVILQRGGHMLQLPAHGFWGITVPAITVDGRRFQRTRVISRALDERFPDPPLFPADPDQRARVEAAERFGEGLQNALRRMFYCAAGRRGPRPIERVAALRHGATAAAVRVDLATLPQQLDQIDGWIADRVIGGEALNAADFQIAPQVSGLLRFDDLAPFIEGRPMAAYARSVACQDDRPRLPRILPRDWLEPLERLVGAGSCASSS